MYELSCILAGVVTLAIIEDVKQNETTQNEMEVKQIFFFKVSEDRGGKSITQAYVI